MPDLHAWITAQIDETERLARRAAELCGCHPPAPSWSFRDGDEPTDGRILVDGDPHPSLRRRISRKKWNGSYDGLFMAEHIVRHDPASVLRRCAADRKILAEHKPYEGSWSNWYACEGCGWNGADYCSDLVTDHVNDCPTLLALAEGYGLTEEQRAGLDRPEKERPPRIERADPPNALVEAYSKAMTELVLNGKLINPERHARAIANASVEGDGTGEPIGFLAMSDGLKAKVVGAPVPMPEWLREDLGLPDAPPEPAPGEQAFAVIEPHLSSLALYKPNPEA